MRRGEIYKLTHEESEFYLMCGDSTRAEDVRHLLRERRRSRLCVMTDPAYSAGRLNNKILGSKGTRSNYEPIRGDVLNETGYRDLIVRMLDRAVPDRVYIFTDWRQLALTGDIIQGAGFALSAEVVWVKTTHDRSKVVAGVGGEWRSAHEDVLAFEKVLQGKRQPGPSVWGKPDVILAPPVPPRNRVHPTQKPVSVVKALMHALGAEEWAVYDPFAGSGTTLLAALERGLKEGYAMEIDERYAAAALGRWPGKTSRVVKIRPAARPWHLSDEERGLRNESIREAAARGKTQVEIAAEHEQDFKGSAVGRRGASKTFVTRGCSRAYRVGITL